VLAAGTKPITMCILHDHQLNPFRQGTRSAPISLIALLNLELLEEPAIGFSLLLQDYEALCAANGSIAL